MGAIDELVLAWPRGESAATLDPLAQPLIELLGNGGVQVHSFEVDPGRVHEQFLQAGRATKTTGGRVLGGFSAGARAAVQLAAGPEPALSARALICLGYPFHARDDPRELSGLEALTRLCVPTLIVQGTRDAHGTRPRVRSYGRLPDCVRMHWLEDGNHRWRPRPGAPTTRSELLAHAAHACLNFLAALPGIQGRPGV